MTSSANSIAFHVGNGPMWLRSRLRSVTAGDVTVSRGSPSASISLSDLETRARHHLTRLEYAAARTHDVSSVCEDQSPHVGEYPPARQRRPLRSRAGVLPNAGRETSDANV